MVRLKDEILKDFQEQLHRSAKPIVLKKTNASNMYGDSVKQWNCGVGCEFDCRYCRNSFQRQMKRQRKNCSQCYEYVPHFHKERLKNKVIRKLPITEGDEFIWVFSSADISFQKITDIKKVFAVIRQLKNRTFLIQSKDAKFLKELDEKLGIPDNVIVGITLETNRDEGYELVSKAPKPSERYKEFAEWDFPRKVLTIEPIQDFDLEIFVEWIKAIKPIRIYIGYDTKQCQLNEPELTKTLKLIDELKKITKVKLKLIREKWNKG